MKTPSQILKEGLEEFDKVVSYLGRKTDHGGKQLPSCLFGYKTKVDWSGVKSFLITHTLNLLEA